MSSSVSRLRCSWRSSWRSSCGVCWCRGGCGVPAASSCRQLYPVCLLHLPPTLSCSRSQLILGRTRRPMTPSSQIQTNTSILTGMLGFPRESTGFSSRKRQNNAIKYSTARCEGRRRLVSTPFSSRLSINVLGSDHVQTQTKQVIRQGRRLENKQPHPRFKVSFPDISAIRPPKQSTASAILPIGNGMRAHAPAKRIPLPLESKTPRYSRRRVLRVPNFRLSA